MMLKLLTAVCFGAVTISLAMNYDGGPPSYIPQFAPIPRSVLNNPIYSPVVPQEKDWSSLFQPNAFPGLKKTGRVPILQRPHIRQMDVPYAVPTNPPIYREMGYPQNSPNQQQPPHCENSEILFKIITIFLHLLDTGGEVNNPDIEKVNVAVKLIKEYLKTAQRDAQNFEVADKLLTLEVALLQNKDIQQSNQEKNIPVFKRSFGTIDHNIVPNDIPSHRLPISPILYKRANLNNIQNLNAKKNEALKSSMGLLMNQSDYNAHAVFELLQSFKPIQPTTSPLMDAGEPVVDDSKFDPNQTEFNSNLLASDYKASQTSYNHSQLSNIVGINDWTNYSKATKIDPLNPNEIELTYALKRPQPLVYQPYYFIKYRLPFNSFLQNLGKVTQIKSTDTPKSELYKSVIQNWNADEISPDLAHFTKEQVNDLVIREGNLVEALLIQSKDKNMRINLNTPENLEAQLSEYNIAKDNTENGDGNHLIEAQASPSYSSDHNDESRRRHVESNIRPGLDTPPKFPGYPSMFQKGPPPTPLKSYNDHLLYKSGFGKTLPAPHLPSSLIET